MITEQGRSYDNNPGSALSTGKYYILINFISPSQKGVFIYFICNLALSKLVVPGQE